MRFDSAIGHQIFVASSLGQKTGAFCFSGHVLQLAINFMRFVVVALLFSLVSGCAVVAVADAAVTVVATTVKVGAAVVGTTVDVAAAGVKAATSGGDSE